MTENYIAKVWLKTPMSMDNIADLLGMRDTKAFTTDLTSEKLVGRVGDRLWVLNLSWGKWNAVEKIKVYAIPGMSSREADEVEEHIQQLLGR